MTELRARDPKIQALIPVSLGAHGLVPKTELFKTNYRDFHCWTRVTGGKENHQKPKQTEKYIKQQFSDTGLQATQYSDSWERGTNEMGPPGAPAYSLGRVSRPQHGEGNPGRAWWSHWDEEAEPGTWGGQGGESPQGRAAEKRGLQRSAEAPWVFGALHPRHVRKPLVLESTSKKKKAE